MAAPHRLDRLHAAIERSTARQLEAITAPEPQVRILAAAGSGKTRVLTLRLARRVAEEELDPTRCVVVTFSRKAADELRTRLFTFGVRGATTSTVHGYAYRLVQEHRASRGRRPAEVLTSRLSLTRQVLSGLPGNYPGLNPASLDAEIGWAKTRAIGPAGYEAAAAAARRKNPAPRSVVVQAFADYESLRARADRLDFDDLLLEANHLLATDAPFAAAVRWRTDHLSLDEAQDLNPVQRDLLVAVMGEDPDLTFVGDPNQAIYGWNGADATLMDELAAAYPTTRTVVLPSNHRSSGAIVDAAAAALGAPGAGHAARSEGAPPTVTAFPDDDAEAAAVASFCADQGRDRGTYAAVAVLARTNQQLQIIAEHLDRRGLPHRFAGAETAPGGDLTARPTGPVVDSGDGPDTVVLSTFHKAKGLEWAAVAVVGLSEGLVPYSAATLAHELDEERRLLYVALTRATDTLALSYAARRVRAGVVEGRRRQPSRWLVEVQDDLERRAAARRPVASAERRELLSSLRRQLEAREPST